MSNEYEQPNFKLDREYEFQAFARWATSRHDSVYIAIPKIIRKLYKIKPGDILFLKVLEVAHKKDSKNLT